MNSVNIEHTGGWGARHSRHQQGIKNQPSLSQAWSQWHDKTWAACNRGHGTRYLVVSYGKQAMVNTTRPA